MTSKIVHVSIVAVALVVGACTSAAAPTTGPTQPPVALQATAVVPTPTPTAAPPSPASSGAIAGGQPSPGSIDPCTLLTQTEASNMMGKALGAGVSTTLDPDRVCTFKSGLTEVKLILAPAAPDAATAAPDAATAQRYWDLERSQVPAGVPLTDLTNFDRSAYATGAVGGTSLSAMFVISGTYFFDLYCGFPACSQDASVAGAQAIVGRLPG
jgi:hypothetical protein